MKVDLIPENYVWLVRLFLFDDDHICLDNHEGKEPQNTHDP